MISGAVDLLRNIASIMAILERIETGQPQPQ